MRILVDYFRSLFCKHEFSREEKYVDGIVYTGIRISATCNKCNYHKTYWKYN